MLKHTAINISPFQGDSISLLSIFFRIQVLFLSSETAARPEWSSFLSGKISQIFPDVKSGNGGRNSCPKNVQGKRTNGVVRALPLSYSVQWKEAGFESHEFRNLFFLELMRTRVNLINRKFLDLRSQRPRLKNEVTRIYDTCTITKTRQKIKERLNVAFLLNYSFEAGFYPHFDFGTK